MPADDEHHLGSQFDFMYHASPVQNRYSIDKTGLRVDFDQSDESLPRAMFMSPKPDQLNERQDVWEVNTSGLQLHPDDPSQMREFQDVGGSWYIKHDVPRERLRRLTEDD